MKTLNQLLSRVKSIFGLKATPATATTPNAEPPTDLSVVSNPRISVAFAAIEKYLAENYSTPTDNLSYQDYANGASFFRRTRYLRHHSSSSRTLTASTISPTT